MKILSGSKESERTRLRRLYVRKLCCLWLTWSSHLNCAAPIVRTCGYKLIDANQFMIPSYDERTPEALAGDDGFLNRSLVRRTDPMHRVSPHSAESSTAFYRQQ